MSENTQNKGRGKFLAPREDFRRPGRDDEISEKDGAPNSNRMRGEGRGSMLEVMKQGYDVRGHQSSSVDHPYNPHLSQQSRQQSRNHSPSSNHHNNNRNHSSNNNRNNSSNNNRNNSSNNNRNNSPSSNYSSNNSHRNNGYNNNNHHNNNNGNNYNNNNNHHNNNNNNNNNNNHNNNNHNNNGYNNNNHNNNNHNNNHHINNNNGYNNNNNNHNNNNHNNNNQGPPKKGGRGRGSLVKKMQQDSPFDDIASQFNSALTGPSQPVGRRNMDDNYGDENGGGDMGRKNGNMGRNGDDNGGKYRGKDNEMGDNDMEGSSEQIGKSRFTPMKLEGQEEDLKSLKGKAGKKISLMSNYIALRCNTEGIVQYHVTYDPTVDCKFQRIRMLHQHDEHLGGTVAFDGMVLFLPKALKKEVTELVSERPTDGEKVKLTIRFIKVPKAKECLQVFNIIFRKVMSKLNMCQIGRNYYLPSEAKNIPRFNLDVWPGYVTSCGAYEAGVMLFMDVSHRVLRTQTALEIMEDLVKRNPDNAQNAIKNLLIGKAVITRYNNRLYRVDDVLWEQSPTSEFSLSNGEKITFLDYYKKSYNLDIEHHEQPLLLSIPKEKNNRNGEKKVPDMICLIPELANMTGLTEEMRTDFQMMRELAKYTKLSPTARRDSLIALCRSINKNASVRNELERWGFELDTDLYRLEGRKLPMETIKFGDSEVSAGPEADWGRAVGNNKVINAVDVQEWLFLATKRDSSKAEEFVTTYKRCAQNMGIRVSNPNLIYLHNDRTENYIAALKEGMHSKVQLVVFLFPSQRGDRYNSIKRLCCIENPVPSQVINARTISDQRKLRSVTQKIALQINCKLGGTLWSVNIPTKSIMVCGVDVNHDGKGSARRSVLAFVSSMNPECTKWYSKVKVQESSEEMASCMKVCLVDALKKYHDVNHKLPDRVVLYRDGVGDGELAMVKDFEVEQLKECMVQSGNKEFRPKLAVIVVQKRINTRLLALEMNSSDLSNPPPGTVVDHSVTKNDWYDFFVVSQHVRQGTVTPTHFVVVHDELGWNADRIQALTYKMTHLYYNWPGTVRVPAPCQYAHKLAFLVGENLKKEPHPQLNDKLFFL